LPQQAWAASAGTAGDVSSCSVETVPIEIMTTGYGFEVMRSAAEISDDLPHFRAFVTTVTEHVAARLARDQLCIKVAGGMKGLESVDSMTRAAFDNRSLLQFVYWRFAMGSGFYVPAMSSTRSNGGAFCRLSSPWIDLAVERKPVPQILGIVYWNERQLLADQAALAGAKNVPLGMVMPLKLSEFGRFASEYAHSEILKMPVAKPIEERVPPDLLWLLRRSWQSTRGPFIGSADAAMHRATEKGAEGYTKLVLALIDRCFASDRADLHYDSILDVADPVLLEPYKIVTPLR
jgi:hypothetical protein